jgi:hypothetical protein
MLRPDFNSYEGRAAAMKRNPSILTSVLELPTVFAGHLRALSRVAGVFALSLVLVACGDSEQSTESRSSTESFAERISVEGADGASVSYLPLADRTSRTATVRVARDGSGAPPLPPGYVAAGPVYQFTPLGLMQAGIEIRVPLDSSAASPVSAADPVLLVAQAGGTWMQPSEVARRGSFLVANVAQLAYAVAAVPPAAFGGTLAKERARAMSVIKSTATSSPPLSIAVDAATTPPLASLGATVGRVYQPTSLVLSVSYNLPAGCTDRGIAHVDALSLSATTLTTRQTTLATKVIEQRSGSFNVATSLSAADNGLWQAVVRLECLADDGTNRFETVGQLIQTLLIVIEGGAAPAITQAPQDANVVEGAIANFSVTATGSDIAYRWQRSSDGGSTYTGVTGANTASTSVTTTLADNNGLWRVVLSNSGGSVTSSPARLSVTQQVLVPAITSDPANQTVVEGQTASFTVSGTGSPSPTTQWQIRSAADASSGIAEQGWVDVAGATANTYITPATTLAQNASQYRAVLQNSAGRATSLPATLAVNAAVVAPAITSQPLAQSVQVGQSGLFSVTASGTSPLSYQWLKNGQTIVGANATEVLILAEAADVGSSYNISVQVSNAGGSVTSALAVMTVTAPPAAGKLISAAEGGFVSASTGAEVEPTLIVPPGALARDATLRVTAQSSSVANLPAQISALGDVIGVDGPAGVTFSTPATLYLAVPDEIAEGKVLAVVELDAGAPAVNASRAADAKRNPVIKRNSTAASTPYSQPGVSNLRRVAAGLGKSPSGVKIMAAGDPLRVLCPSPQAVRGGNVLVDLTRAAVKFVVAAAPQDACTGNTTTRPRGVIPSTTTAPCTDAEFPTAEGVINQVSRHVHCQIGRAPMPPLVYSPPNRPTINYAPYRLEWKIGSDGVAKDLDKTYRIKLRLVREPGSGAAIDGLRVLPVFDCGSDAGQGQCRAQIGPPIALGGGGEIEFITKVDFSWSAGDGTYREVQPSQIQLKLIIRDEDPDTVQRSIFLSQPPAIRCDKKMAVSGGRGCVYAQAPATYVLTVGGPEKEAAEHIRDAQVAGSRGGLTRDGNQYFAAVSNSLQRTRFEAVKEGNRRVACGSGNDSLRASRPAPVSASCQQNSQGCECDEYPYASTYNGASFDASGTSVRIIKGNNNGVGGLRHLQFLQAERVLDFTATEASEPNGESFWVHIE